MCTTWLTSACLSFQDFSLSWIKYTILTTILQCTGLQFVYKVQLKLILVYCTCFIKTVRVFTVSAESLPRRSHTHSDTPTRHPHYSPMHPHQWDVRVKTPEIRQLLGDRVVDLFFNFFFFWKREAWGNAFGHYNAN